MIEFFISSKQITYICESEYFLESLYNSNVSNNEKDFGKIT